MLLLDTCALLWLAADHARLSDEVITRLIRHPDNATRPVASWLGARASRPPFGKAEGEEQARRLRSQPDLHDRTAEILDEDGEDGALELGRPADAVSEFAALHAFGFSNASAIRSRRAQIAAAES